MLVCHQVMSCDVLSPALVALWCNWLRGLVVHVHMLVLLLFQAVGVTEAHAAPVQRHVQVLRRLIPEREEVARGAARVRAILQVLGAHVHLCAEEDGSTDPRAESVACSLLFVGLLERVACACVRY